METGVNFIIIYHLICTRRPRTAIPIGGKLLSARHKEFQSKEDLTTFDHLQRNVFGYAFEIPILLAGLWNLILIAVCVYFWIGSQFYNRSVLWPQRDIGRVMQQLMLVLQAIHVGLVVSFNMNLVNVFGSVNSFIIPTLQQFRSIWNLRCKRASLRLKP